MTSHTELGGLPKWNLQELRGTVERLHGGDQATRVWRSSQSIVKRQEYMKYHYTEVERLVGPDLNDADSQDILVNFILGDTPEYHEFHHRRTHAEANLLALLQCVHAIEDTLAHVIYFAKNIDRLDADKISISSVQKLLPIGALRDEVQSMLDNPDLRHVAALVNTSKHRSVVSAQLSVSFVESELPHGLKFEAFEHRGKSYPQRWAVPFTKLAFNAIQQHMLQIGVTLNQDLTPRS